MSVATLSDAPLNLMCSVDTAPLIKAVVVGKGGDFANTPGASDGNPYMPQASKVLLLLLMALCLLR